MTDQTKAADLAQALRLRHSHYGEPFVCCPLCDSAELLKSQAKRIAELEAALTLTPEKIRNATRAIIRIQQPRSSVEMVEEMTSICLDMGESALLAVGFQEPEATK